MFPLINIPFAQRCTEWVCILIVYCYMDNITFHPLLPKEYPLLRAFLYQAVFVPKGQNAPPQDIVDLPELKIYTEDFGSHPGDLSLAAEKEGQIIGVVWCRLMRDFGYYRDGVPSLAMAVVKEWRGKGIGSCLLKQFCQLVGDCSFSAISLSVQKLNPAVRLYQRAGFQVVRENKDDLIMLYHLTNQQ